MNSPAIESEDTFEPRGLEAWVPLASALLAIAFGSAFVVGGPDFCLDDAWIHLSYAKSLASGEGLSYNPGDAETGFSSPLWVLMLALWPTKADPVASVKMLGVLMHGVTAWLAAAFTLRLGARRATVEAPVPVASLALLAGALVAVQPSALQAAVSGMEVSLTSALTMGLALTSSRRQWGPAAALAAAAVLARPEMLGFGLALSAGLVLTGSRAAWRVGAAAVLAMALWVAYCLAVSGHPLPNTYYVKTSGSGETLAFLWRRVLAIEPWFIGLGGIVGILLCLRGEWAAKESFLPVWLGAWLLTFIAIAASRPLNPGVTFYESRYFAILGAAPLLVIAWAPVHMPRWLAGICLAPVFLLSGLGARSTLARVHDQETDIALLHTQPGRYVAGTLPPDAVVAVEGAGALRYWTPRSMRILDALGLNWGALAHAPDDAAKACELVRAAPDFAVLPDHIARPLSRVFDLRPLQRFDDPHYAIVDPPQPMRVVLFAVDGVAPTWSQRCGLAASRRGG